MAQLAREIRDVLTEVYDSVWVAGEVQRVHRSQRGHLYFELVEKGYGDRIVGKLDAVIWRTAFERIDRRLQRDGGAIREGLALRCRGRVDFYAEGGRLQVIVDEVDPLFTLGMLEQRRREIKASLEKSGLLERNRGLALPDVPLDIGLVTSHDSAAFHDFLSTLSESGYGFRVTFVHAATQGSQAEYDVASALELLGTFELDAVAVVRGGGSRADLAAFDSRRITEAVARSRWPVLTGLGHEIDTAIADLAAHTALKTPTKVAELLVERARAAEGRLEACEEGLLRLSRERLRRASDALGHCERVAQVGQLRLRAAERDLDATARTLGQLAARRLGESARRLDETERQLVRVVPRHLESRRQVPEQLLQRISATASHRLREAATHLGGLERLCHALAPERLLERGFSITRRADGGIVRHTADALSGDLITTQLAHGSLKSRVEDS